MKTVSLKNTKIGTITPLITAALLQSNAADTFWKSAIELCSSSNGKTIIPLFKKDQKSSILNGTLIIGNSHSSKGLFTIMLSSDGQHKLIDAENATSISIVEIKYNKTGDIYYGIKIPEDYFCYFSGFIDDLTVDIEDYTDESFTINAYLETNESKEVITSSLSYSTSIKADCSVKIYIEESSSKAFLRFDVLDENISYLDSMDKGNICKSIELSNGILSLKFNDSNEKKISFNAKTLKDGSVIKNREII